MVVAGRRRDWTRGGAVLRWCRVELCSGAGVQSMCGTGVPVVVDRLWSWCPESCLLDVWLFRGAR